MKINLWAKRLAAVTLLALMVAGCSTMELRPVYSSDGPTVTIASHDVTWVKSAILSVTAAEHFKVAENTGDYVDVSRRLPALKVLLLTETYAGKKDLEILRFHVETVPAGVNVHVYRVEQMELPGGGLNQDSMIDKNQYRALQKLLGRVKQKVEGDQRER